MSFFPSALDLPSTAGCGDARIRARHNLVTLPWGRIGQASQQWAIHREMSTASLLGMEAALDCRDESRRAMDDMSDLDLDTDGDPPLVAGLQHKRPGGLAINWGCKTVLIMNKRFCPLLEQYFSLFKHFAEMGSILPRQWFILLAFKIRPRKGVIWGGAGGVSCSSPKGICDG